MYYVENNITNPFYNLSLEEYLFGLDIEDDIYMLWRNSPSVIFGAYQNPFREINLPFTWEKDIAVLRRISGGGTVYHDLGNINFSIISRESASKNYGYFLQPIVHALQRLGYPVSHKNSSDIYLADKKISGNAQKRSKNKILHHGTLLFDADFSTMGHCLTKKVIIQGSAIDSRPASVINLKEYKNIDQNAEVFLKQLSQMWIPDKARQLILSKSEKELIESRANGIYKTWQWTFDKCPPFEVKSRLNIKGTEYIIRYRVIKNKVIACDLDKENNLSKSFLNDFIGMTLKKEHLIELAQVYEIKNLDKLI